MKRIKHLGFAAILAITALVSGTSEAAVCDASRCFNLNCSNHVCPAGQVALPRCNLTYCYFYCGCVTVP